MQLALLLLTTPRSKQENVFLRLVVADHYRIAFARPYVFGPIRTGKEGKKQTNFYEILVLAMEVIACNNIIVFVIIPCVNTNAWCDLVQVSDDRSCFGDDCDVRFVARHHEYGRFAILHSLPSNTNLHAFFIFVVVRLRYLRTLPIPFHCHVSVHADGQRRSRSSRMTLSTDLAKCRNCTKLLTIFSFTALWRCVTIYMGGLVPVSLPQLVC